MVQAIHFLVPGGEGEKLLLKMSYFGTKGEQAQWQSLTEIKTITDTYYLLNLH